MRTIASLFLVVASASAQYAGGTIFQSLDAFQPAGVTGVGLLGNGSLTTGEILVFTNGWTNGARSLFSAEALGAVLGDRNGDGKPFDWVNVDALHLATWSPTTAQPTPFDFRYSFEYDLVNGSGAAVITSGDVFKLTANGAYSVTIARGAFISALGFQTPVGYALNLDGYAELADGSVLVSFKNNVATGLVGQGTNIISPLFGTPSTQTIYGSDIFVVRPPFGSLPAIKVYQASDFQPLANALFSSYGTVTEIRDFDVQPLSTATNNPYDILNLWNGGDRPQIVFHFYGDENPVCTQASTSPTATNIWALVQGASGVGKYATNVSATPAPVYMDALALSSTALPAGSAFTIDTTPHTLIAVPGLGTNAFAPQFAPGSTVTFVARNLDGGANRYAAFLLGFGAATGTGLALGTGGYGSLFIDQNDALLPIVIQSPYSALLTTGASDVNGTASTAAFPIPANIAAINFYVQAIQLGPIYPLSAPQALRVQ